MIKNQIKIYINNNPKCNVKLFSAVKNEEWVMENEPFIKIFGAGFQNDKVTLNVYIGDKLIHSDVVITIDNRFEVKVSLDKLLTSDESIVIKANNQTFEFQPSFTKVTGTVKYLDGSPVKQPIINFTSRDVSVIGDDNGNYEMILSEKEDQIGIFDQNYSVNTLEVWLSNLDLSCKNNMNFIIDKLEVYRMNMWSGEQSNYIHFIPMSVTRVKKVMDKGYTSELDLIMDPEVWVNLEKSNVKVYVEEEECRILTFSKIDDYLVEVEDNMFFRPSYILSIPKTDRNKMIKIEITSEVEYNEAVVKEYGQGYYYW